MWRAILRIAEIGTLEHESQKGGGCVGQINAPSIAPPSKDLTGQQQQVFETWWSARPSPFRLRFKRNIQQSRPALTSTVREDVQRMHSLISFSSERV